MSRRPRKPKLRAGVPGVLVLDSGAIDKLARGDERARAMWRALTEQGWSSLLPAAVLSEIVTGRADDARINRVIAAIEIGVEDEEVGRLAGTLRFRARRSGASGVDALVAAHGARARHAIVLTGDVRDLEALLAECPNARVAGV